MKKNLLFIGLSVLFFASAMAQNNVGIGTTTPNASAALDVQSTTQGMLVPRMTAAQRGQIGLPGTPPTGLLVYQTDATAGFYFYNGSAWTSLNGATGPTGAAGAQGIAGPTGPTGAAGAAGQGVPTGGTANQVLAKVDATNYNTQWVTPASGGSSDNLGNHTATQALDMANKNITNVNNIKSKELFYDLQTTPFMITGRSITSATLNMTGKTIIKIAEAADDNFDVHGIGGGSHGKVIYLWGNTTAPTFRFNSTTESCETCRFSTTIQNAESQRYSGKWLVRLIYDSTDLPTGGTSPGRWIFLDGIE